MIRIAKAACVAAVFGLASQMALAGSAAGLWKTIDDETHQAKALVQINEGPNGELSGKVIKLYQHPDAVCDKCDGANKDKPVNGMQILWGLKKDGEEWSDGKILDPKSGKIYTSGAKLIEDGKKLRVRGYIGPFFRSQVWERQQ
ncbi:DUF2147 domain-containing protein [Chromobacterium amazonense]|uniref:DUF2147 domain-containing protein n=1 Tax=Chromobacterium amazonense TaxID=1382803 RepID=A0A2S9X7Y3_9NEIS|nr:DUF2147 domain-containing protein [Chromobacterium amazonense]KIA81304.1 signal peptide protein [Chromobacterium piscinae]MBM2882852.1 DUF2147 domain-containing protein [Chromobacterium amazonense]MDE1713101.1 DUF2147 domain-containing protein [Chromobacterium amazonense]MDQ4539618.1 DUF2147 domain-containing protein [Chromobacterium amazonense]PRP71831.1 hypothetical protein BUE93_04090 [Chromobacterium amazonense]